MKPHQCEVYCCICRGQMDANRRYGRDAMCCSKECYAEYVWRGVLSDRREAYRPRQQPSGNDSTPSPSREKGE